MEQRLREWGYDHETVVRLGALWGKSRQKAGGQMNLLLSHLLDTAAVAEQLWDGFLAPSTRRVLDDLAGGQGRGRRLFSWLCGVHDCGKATPAFQRMDEEGAQGVRATGLAWHDHLTKRFQREWRHDKAGGCLVSRVLRDAGWPKAQIAWVWPLVAGHHGLFPSAGDLQEPPKAKKQLQGDARWQAAQQAVVEVFTRELGFAGLADVQPVVVPSRAVQLHLSGLVVMADWIASDERHFQGVDDLRDVSLEGARGRAAKAWSELGLRGGWGAVEVPGPEFFQDRFGHGARGSQVMVVEAARRMAAPGLLVVEAPMGEGKTKAALAAAEILAARFGADGVFVGMPTQATSDPMFSQVRAWAKGIDVSLAAQVALLHGKRMFNQEWRELLEGGGDDPDARYGSVDAYGMPVEDDEFGSAAATFGAEGRALERRAPALWFLGRNRGLLCPFVVGTIDQLLFAATRTKHVMLRMAGLAGKVVVLDEVHAADVYMSQFLKEGLRWLGQARVPVVLLSATLPPAQRRELVEAYLAGAASREEFAMADLPEPQGYPSVTAAWLAAGGEPQVTVEHTAAWRDDLPVRVEVLPERIARDRAEREAAQAAADEEVAARLGELLQDGGCALVIRNTVARAQSLFEMLRSRFGEGEVRLLHARLTVRDRADRTRDCLAVLGPPPEAERPERLVLVATQLAEQSFDIDADVLVSDLAPVDLLLQRIGRVHRHGGVTRPAAVAEPRVIVTGVDTFQEGASRFLGGSEFIYGRYLLLRTAAAVAEASGGTWSIPGQVPELVGRVYGGGDGLVPQAWAEDEAAARADWENKQRERTEKAARYLLTRLGEHEARTLEGLHFAGASAGGSEEELQAVVRDGDCSVEVVLVQGGEEGGYGTLAGRRLGPNGEVTHELLDEVLGATVRLPPALTSAAQQELGPLPGWRSHTWLRYTPALVLDADRRAKVGEYVLRYDDLLGLVQESAPVRAGRGPGRR